MVQEATSAACTTEERLTVAQENPSMNVGLQVTPAYEDKNIQATIRLIEVSTQAKPMMKSIRTQVKPKVKSKG